MEQWWNDTDRGKLKYWEKKMFPLDFVYYICHREWSGTKPGSPL
jgi:hypothetical protein